MTGEIPLADADIEVVLPSAQTSALPAAFGAPCILCVDDNHANLKLIEVFLSEMGAETEIATSGFEALSKVKQRRFDLVFMDVQMPGMDGVETTQKIRQLDNGRHMPIIALTAHALAEEKNQLLKSGFDDYLTKPIDEDQLVTVILRKTGHRLTPRVGHLPQPFQNRVAPLKPSSKAALGPCVDIDNSVKLAGGKSGLAEELFCMLLDHLDEDYDDIGELWRANERAELLERVHKLHGATRYCGVPGLRQLAGKLETELKKGVEDLQRSVEALLNEIDRIRYWAEHNDWQSEFRAHEATTANAKT